MSDERDPDLEARLEAWFANRAATGIPASFAERIASIPRTSASAPRPRLAPVRAGGRRPSGLLAAAAVATALAVIAGGSLLAGGRRSGAVVDTSAPSRSSSAIVTTVTPQPTSQPGTPPPTSQPIWPTDFRSDGVLPSSLADGVEHGTIDTSIGRLRWVHLTGDATSLPDPLVPMQMPNGELAWFSGGGPGAACYNDPKSATCTDPPTPELSVSSDALAPREPRRLPVTVSEASLWLDGDTFWFTSADPLTAWSSPDLETWQQTDLSGLQSPGPASIGWRTTISPYERVGGAVVASVEYTAADAGGLLGYPGRQVRLVQAGGGYAAHEFHPRRDGGDKDLGAIEVVKTAAGLAFMNADGREVGRVDGAGMEFVDQWVARATIDYWQLAVLDGGHWSPVALPVAPLTDWPMLVKVGDALHAVVVQSDQRVRAWRTLDGHAWTGGDVLLAEDGSPMRSSGTTSRDGETGPVLIVFGNDDASGWQSTDGDTWTPASFASGEIPATRFAHGWLRTGDQTLDGAWQVSSDGSTWESVPALRGAITKVSPSGAGSSSASAVGNTVFFSVDEGGSPFSRDVWMLEFEKPPS